jgi:hypothetical protein
VSKDALGLRGAGGGKRRRTGAIMLYTARNTGRRALARTLAIAVAAFFALSGIAPAAEGEGPGQLVALACGVVPPKARLDVQLSDDTPREKALREAIAAALKGDGFAVATDAPVRVTFEAQINRVLDPTRKGYIGKVDATNRAQEFQLNLWSSEGDSVLGGVQRPAGSTGPNVNHLTVFVHDKANGRCLWQGEATHPMEGPNEVEALRRLVPVVLKHFGKTVPLTAFSLDD